MFETIDITVLIVTNLVQSMLTLQSEFGSMSVIILCLFSRWCQERRCQ